MFEKLESYKNRWDELTEEISQPEVIQDYPRYQACLKERASLEETVSKYTQYLDCEKQLTDLLPLLKDPDLAEEAESEKSRLEEKKDTLLEDLRLLLVPQDPLDSRNVIMEIRAGTGGEEAALFAGDLLRMYQKYCDGHALTLRLLSVSETDLGGISKALMMISGSDSFARMKFESGVHCVKRVPDTESSGRIHTSTATVACLPEAEEIELELNPNDLRIDVFHATGHGGQGVNTTDSAVRITHLPTGMVVSCQDERSQLENKARALKVLRSRLLDAERESQKVANAEERRNQIGSGDRSERIRTYYFNHDYVVDHRLGLTVNRTQTVIDGNLDPFIDALRLAEKTEKLRSLHE